MNNSKTARIFSSKSKLTVILSILLCFILGFAFLALKINPVDTHKIVSNQMHYNTTTVGKTEMESFNQNLDTRWSTINMSLVEEVVTMANDGELVVYQFKADFYFEYNSNIFVGGWIDYEEMTDLDVRKVEFLDDNLVTKSSAAVNPANSKYLSKLGYTVNATIEDNFNGDYDEARFTMTVRPNGTPNYYRWGYRVHVTTGSDPKFVLSFYEYG